LKFSSSSKNLLEVVVLLKKSLTRHTHTHPGRDRKAKPQKTSKFSGPDPPQPPTTARFKLPIAEAAKVERMAP
jgi:hypothetical protein